MQFNFFPLGTGGGIVISRIEIVPEPSTICLAIAALIGAAIASTLRPGLENGS
jgi:hypothetical protein